jgi:UDP-N-acetylmuramoyl-L-alanyl-D-glutamate--2,6-diaminopimelate ligase
MQLQKILKSLSYISVVNEQQINVSSINYNSTKCENNSLFVAIKGITVDGNIFINDAISNGAKVIVTENIPANLNSDITYITVKNSRIALAELSHLFYDFPAKKLKIIGITGTNGKTTTTFLIKSILETAGKNVAIIGTTGIYINNKIIETTHTTPESLELAMLFNEMINEKIEYVVMEVSSHSLAMNRVFGIDFSVAAFTNLTHDHLDLHNTFEEYASTKKLLFDSLATNSIAVFNGDDEYFNFMLSNCIANKIVVSNKNQNADYFINDVNITKHSSSFSLENKNKKFEVSTVLTAFFNIQNAALAVVICLELGISKDDVLLGISKSKGASGRLELVRISTGAAAYVDYAHTPDALEKSLIACKSLLTVGGKLICVFGCGGDRDKTKRPLMGAIAEKYSDVVIITDDNPRTENSKAIIDDILCGIKDTVKTKVIHSRSEAIKYAVSVSTVSDIILVAGKGHESYQIIGKEKYYFSDVDELSQP